MTKKNKQRHPFRTFILWVMLILGIGGIGYYIYQVFGTYTYKDINHENLGVTELPEPENTKIQNIALFGVDARKGENSRSDAMIVLSIDSARGKLKMSSLMRDAYVTVKDHGLTKLCHAYAYGGPELAINAINSNYNLDITEYATVNFSQMAQIIDGIGGVDIDVSADEMKEANKFVWEFCMQNNIKFDYIKEAGPQTLSGMQAVAYGRIRKGNTGGDVARTGRQQLVLEKMMEKVMDMNVMQYPALAAQLMPYVETSLTTGEIISVATQVLKHGKPQITRATFPTDGDWTGKTTEGGMWVAAYDDAQTQERMRKFIYDDISVEEQKAQEKAVKDAAKAEKEAAKSAAKPAKVNP